jgi:hypothetical protein
VFLGPIRLSTQEAIYHPVVTERKEKVGIIELGGFKLQNVL